MAVMFRTKIKCINKIFNEIIQTKFLTTKYIKFHIILTAVLQHM